MIHEEANENKTLRLMKTKARDLQWRSRIRIVRDVNYASCEDEGKNEEKKERSIVQLSL